MRNEHQRETAFLRQCILYDESPERGVLESKISQLQRDEGCVRRAGWLMTWLTGLAVAGLGYSAVFLEDFPQRMSVFGTRLIVKSCCALGFGSLICLLVFAVLGMVYRKKLDRRREECRRLVTRLLESRLGKPVTAPRQHVRDDRNGEGTGSTIRMVQKANGSPGEI